uniref:Small ribosomal subunit protein bS18c n=1 Tax=Acetabularia acetabulum TaxID=35845 RepID=W6M9Z8_ACEAT|nr:chloroplast 30S ribosomal protein S18 [Acetabularia acetabulum]
MKKYKKRILNSNYFKIDQNSLQEIKTIDYKNLILLRRFISSEGKILPKKVTGLNAKTQRAMQRAIKNARMIGLLPFVPL